MGEFIGRRFLESAIADPFAIGWSVAPGVSRLCHAQLLQESALSQDGSGPRPSAKTPN